MTQMRKRTFQYGWCGMTEVDYVCMRCETIVLDGVTCQWCMRNRVNPPPAPGEEKVNHGLAKMREVNKRIHQPKPPKPKSDRPPGYVNPGIIAMREKNRLRREAKLAAATT